MKTNNQTQAMSTGNITIIILSVIILSVISLCFYFYSSITEKSTQQLQLSNQKHYAEIQELQLKIEQLQTELDISQNALANHQLQTPNNNQNKNQQTQHQYHRIQC